MYSGSCSHTYQLVRTLFDWGPSYTSLTGAYDVDDPPAAIHRGRCRRTFPRRHTIASNPRRFNFIFPLRYYNQILPSTRRIQPRHQNSGQLFWIYQITLQRWKSLIPIYNDVLSVPLFSSPGIVKTNHLIMKEPRFTDGRSAP